MPRRSKAVDQLAAAYTATCNDPPGVDTVSFQPLLTRTNQDRIVTKKWTIDREEWLFLAVCDGHSGTTAASYTVERLPDLVQAALTDDLGTRARRSSDAGFALSKILCKVVEDFDRSIGAALNAVCADPASLTEEHARELIAKHSVIVERAFYGTTLSAAAINVTQQRMWAIGVGDSTVALAQRGTPSGRVPKRLVKPHTLEDPQEYFQTAMRHSASERGIFEGGCVLGSLAMTRAIGNFSLKYTSAYLTHLFKFLPTTATRLDTIAKLSKTPPYITARPSVKYVDLKTTWESSVVILYTDGVDALVSGNWVFHKDSPCEADPCAVVSDLLDPQLDVDAEAVEKLERTLGHKIRVSSTDDCNRAVQLLANLVGGADEGRLNMIMDQALLARGEEGIYVDDTSIIICDLRRV